MVQIKLERAGNTTAHIEISVERPEALALLMRDQPALHTALDRAGVPAEGRTLSFQLSDSDRPAAGDRGGGHSRAMPADWRSGRQGGAEPNGGRAARQLRVPGVIHRLSTGLDITA